MILPSEGTVAVITPVYNGSATLGRLAYSLSRQGLPQGRLIWIVVDDASTDGSCDLAAHLGERVGLQTLVTSIPQSVGAGRARDEGVRLASTTWVTFVDADDYLEDGALSQWVQSATSTRSDLMMAAPPAEVQGRMRSRLGDTRILSSSDRWSSEFFRSWGVYGKLYRVEAVARSCATFGAAEEAEDLLFFSKVALSARRISFVANGPNYVYPTPASSGMALAATSNRIIFALDAMRAVMAEIEVKCPVEHDWRMASSPVLGGASALFLRSLANSSNFADLRAVRCEYQKILSLFFAGEGKKRLQRRDRFIITVALVHYALPPWIARAVSKCFVRGHAYIRRLVLSKRR